MNQVVWVVGSFFALAGVVHAATQEDVKKAFDQAQKKGAVAVWENHCGGPSTLYFSGSTAEQVAKVAAAMAASGAANGGVVDNGCASGQSTGDMRVLELYPDGSVKAR